MTRFALFRAPAEPPHVEVAHEGRAYRVGLRRHRTARRITLVVDGAKGAATMLLPMDATVERAQAFAQSRAGWIASRLEDVPLRVPFEAGMEIPLRGVSHRIVRWSDEREAPWAGTDAAGTPTLFVSGPGSSVPRQVRAFLEREALSDLTAAAARYARLAGVVPNRIRLKDTTSRWGSCSHRGNLNFSWRLVMAPAFVLDYLAAHEVGHLREMNHSDRYWEIVRGMCPATDRAEAWLKGNGVGLHRFG